MFHEVEHISYNIRHLAEWEGIAEKTKVQLLSLVQRLDDLHLIRQLDASNMLEAVQQGPARLIDSDHYFVRTHKKRFSNLVLMGMGGSASAADVVHNWLEARIQIPSMVLRGPVLPRFIGGHTFFIAVSYSGNTDETIRAFQTARRRGASILGVGTGGKLALLCQQCDLPFVAIPKTIAPRAGLPELVAAIGAIVENLGLTSNVVKQMIETGVELKHLSRSFRIESQIINNRAKQFALKVYRRFVVSYALERMSAVARRFKNQLAENSKVMSKFDTLPEAGHNDVESWQSQGRNFLPVFIRDSHESLMEKKLVGAFQSTVEASAGTSALNVRVPAVTSLGRLMAPILFLDYVSVYLAILRGVDPTPTEMIAKYKEEIVAGS